MKALKDNLDKDEIPPQYQFGETSDISSALLSILGGDYDDDYYYDKKESVTERDYSGDEETSGTPKEGTEGTDDEGEEEEEGDEEEEEGEASEDNFDRHMAVKAPVATADPGDSYEVPEDIANNK